MIKFFVIKNSLIWTGFQRVRPLVRLPMPSGLLQSHNFLYNPFNICKTGQRNGRIQVLYCIYCEFYGFLDWPESYINGTYIVHVIGSLIFLFYCSYLSKLYLFYIITYFNYYLIVLSNNIWVKGYIGVQFYTVILYCNKFQRVPDSWVVLRLVEGRKVEQNSWCWDSWF